jgi:hypothetical protein
MTEITDGSKVFRSTLERMRGNGVSWLIVRLPFSVEKLWKTRGAVRVNVEVGGFNYRTAVFPTRSGKHFLIVNRKMQKAARIGLGDTGLFKLTPDFSPRLLRYPEELETALNQERALRKWFDRLSYSARKSLLDEIANAKSSATRLKRAERVAEIAMEAMEAERDLPPVLRLSLARHPGAEQAWQNLSETQRRHNLLSIFHCRTPESRLNRLEKLIKLTALT